MPWSRRWFRLILLLPGAVMTAMGSPAAEPVDHSLHVKPIFKVRCDACHGAMKREAGLHLDTGASIRRGGDGGPAVESGRADERLDARTSRLALGAGAWVDDFPPVATTATLVLVPLSNQGFNSGLNVQLTIGNSVLYATESAAKGADQNWEASLSVARETRTSLRLGAHVVFATLILAPDARPGEAVQQEIPMWLTNDTLYRCCAVSLADAPADARYHFILNDDLERIVPRPRLGQGRQLAKAFEVLTLLFNGVPMLFMGQETGETRPFSFDSSAPALNPQAADLPPASAADSTRVLAWFRQLMRLRNAPSQELQGDSNDQAVRTGNRTVGFNCGRDRSLFVVVTFGTPDQSHDSASLGLQSGTAYKEIFNSSWPTFQVEFEPEQTNDGYDARIHSGDTLRLPFMGAVALLRARPSP